MIHTDVDVDAEGCNGLIDCVEGFVVGLESECCGIRYWGGWTPETGTWPTLRVKACSVAI